MLAGDVGGTKTRLVICRSRGGTGEVLVKKTYPSREFESLEEIIHTFLAEHEYTASRACFGVAGPVKGESARITNLPWTISSTLLRERLGFEEVILLNDLEAMAYGISLVEPEQLEIINEGIPVKGGVRALIAPGTGLGVVFLTWQQGRYKAHASEGGHTEFGPRNDLEVALLNYLRRKYDHVSYEKVCSGVGIPHLYDFFRDTCEYDIPKEFETSLRSAGDKTPLIVNAAMEQPGDNPICVAVVELFASILAAQAGNLALMVACYGGLYIGGGIPPRMIDFIKSEDFLRSFRDKGRLSSMVADIPIRLITKPDLAISGVISHGLNR